MEQPKYEIGATVYRPWAHAYTTKQIPCTVCAGKKFVTIILGSGEHQRIECGACGRVGCDPASGTETAHVPDRGITVGTVTGISLRNDGWHYEVNDGSAVCETDLYETAEAAHARADVMFPVVELQAQIQFEENCMRNKRTLLWSAHYHRSALARLRREAEYHEEKLNDPRCKERKEKPVAWKPIDGIGGQERGE